MVDQEFSGLQVLGLTMVVEAEAGSTSAELVMVQVVLEAEAPEAVRLHLLPLQRLPILVEAGVAELLVEVLVDQALLKFDTTRRCTCHKE
jgi:predicted aconitase with swiveling domain